MLGKSLLYSLSFPPYVLSSPFQTLVCTKSRVNLVKMKILIGDGLG